MIKIQNLKFSYNDKNFRLTIPSMQINQTEKVAITGPSGSGKTTLINLIAGVLSADSGKISIHEIVLNQYDPEDLQDLRILKMGMIFQEFELLEYLSVLDNILLPYRINPILTLNQNVQERAETLASDLGIADKLKRKPENLSQGERQRTAVCRALLTQPALILGDEPTGNLDHKNRDHVIEVLFNYGNEHDIPLIIVTHDQDLVRKFDRIIDVQEFSETI